MTKKEYKQLFHNIRLMCKNSESNDKNLKREINFKCSNGKMRIVFSSAFNTPIGK